MILHKLSAGPILGSNWLTRRRFPSTNSLCAICRYRAVAAEAACILRSIVAILVGVDNARARIARPIRGTRHEGDRYRRLYAAGGTGVLRTSGCAADAGRDDG